MVNFKLTANSVTAEDYQQDAELTVTVEPNNMVISMEYGENFFMQGSEIKEFMTLLELKLKENNFNV